MAGQHLRLGRDGQGRELAQALVHLPAVAALEVGAADAALKDRVAHEEIVFTLRELDPFGHKALDLRPQNALIP